MKLMSSAAVAACLLAPTATLAECLAPSTFVTTFAAPCVMALSDLEPATGPKHLRVESDPAPASGSKRLRIEPAVPAYGVGDAFPIYDYSMMIDPPRYGLPPVTGNWRYYRTGGHTYKVDAQSYAVLDVLQAGESSRLK